MSKFLCAATLLACFAFVGCAGDNDLVVRERDSAATAIATTPNPTGHIPKPQTHDANGWPTGGI